MGLGLDLSESRNKLTRAAEHLHALDEEIRIALDQAGANEGRLGEADPNTGWYPIYIARKEIPKITQMRISVLVGDAIHNMRCALDYIISELVVASGASIERRHQFPVIEDPLQYEQQIWRYGEPIGRGSLRNVKHGLAEIEFLQPYHTHPSPDHSSLWTINRFSNYDKHRNMTSQFSILGSGPIEMTFGGANPTAARQFTQRNWNSDGDILVAAFRFDRPPPEAQIKAQMSQMVVVTVGKTERDQLGRGINTRGFTTICNDVRAIIDQFERL